MEAGRSESPEREDVLSADFMDSFDEDSPPTCSHIACSKLRGCISGEFELLKELYISGRGEDFFKKRVRLSPSCAVFSSSAPSGCTGILYQHKACKGCAWGMLPEAACSKRCVYCALACMKVMQHLALSAL